ncbi:hypothetical protein CP972_33870 [Streptomyces prasinus]|uniref:Uncharacterized protein n=1 Tax=Streptomyces prasinus TaxID=67345 RepID=A0ABX6B6P6_9ACTN|nr:hypothetical protein CP972_33870 [Streptomyces prasinus]
MPCTTPWPGGGCPVWGCRSSSPQGAEPARTARPARRPRADPGRAHPAARAGATAVGRPER